MLTVDFPGVRTRADSFKAVVRDPRLRGPRRAGDDGERRGWRDGCFAAGMPAMGEGLAGNLKLRSLPGSLMFPAQGNRAWGFSCN